MTDQTPSEPQPTHPRSPRSGTGQERGRSLFTRASAAWVAVGSALVLLVLLIIFMLQNPTPIAFHFLGLTVSLPAGLAVVIAAVAGGVVVAVAGSARIVQLRKGARERRDT